ncbi:glutamate decarboxylase 1 [Tothia fuscella]|uniref:Glutamate decarboxylase 1 n=1 Tax=Tothia fuscella TaxID=1048955 RepID=A0A9P4TXD4_9PEZI|nr:glutamate decarboxylase 1 [Tothia fuscella]
MAANDTKDPILNRADEVSDLISSIQELIHPFIAAADNDAAAKSSGHGLAIPGGGPRTALVEYHAPNKLSQILNLDLPSDRKGKEGVLALTKQILGCSVNTWDQGFLDKLYGSTNAVGVLSELLLSILNTNVHVYQVSPVLTLIEKHVTRSLADLVGFTGPRRGGISQPGGSASNSTSIIIARNTKFPETKTEGYGSRKFVLFTSKHGHYSVEKAAQMFGFGTNAVKSVDVDDEGRMLPEHLSQLIKESRERGETPFYVIATAGTTVLGSFDPLDEIAEVCAKEELWLHVDGSWGGPIIFSEKLRKDRMKGLEKVDSFAITPHKMMGVPLTCSFLVGKDTRLFRQANGVDAEYLFHGTNTNEEVYDLADSTPQCGRKGDALKLFLGWTYYGKEGYGRAIERSFEVAEYLFDLLSSSSNFVLVSQKPLPCLQVCFYYAKDGNLGQDVEDNGKVTEEIARKLVPRGFMVDYAPGEKGKFFRVVVGRETLRGTMEGLVKAIESIGEDVGAK